MKNVPILPIGLLLGGGVVVYKLLQKFGLFSTKSERQNTTLIESAENAPDSNSFWSPTAKLPKGALLLKAATGKTLSTSLWNAKGFFNDNEEKIYGVFRGLKTRSQVSSLAHWFLTYRKEDLYFWLKSFLSEKEFGTIIKIVNSKPKFKP